MKLRKHGHSITRTERIKICDNSVCYTSQVNNFATQCPFTYLDVVEGYGSCCLKNINAHSDKVFEFDSEEK